MRQPSRVNTVQYILNYIKEVGKFDDWRDVFESIRNWGYNSDFTYNPITDTNKSTVKAYLLVYIKDVYGDHNEN